MNKELREVALAQFHETQVGVNNVFVQFINLENTPRIRFFTISEKKHNMVRFLDNAEILDTNKRKMTSEENDMQRLDLEYYFNPTLGEIGKFNNFVFYLKEHNSDLRGVINNVFQDRSDFIPNIEKELSEILSKSENEEEQELPIKDFVALQERVNEKLEEYWPSPMPTLQEMHKKLKESIREF